MVPKNGGHGARDIRPLYHNFWKCALVAVKRCIFIFWEDAKKYLEGFPDAEYQRFDHWRDAIGYVLYAIKSMSDALTVPVTVMIIDTAGDREIPPNINDNTDATEITLVQASQKHIIQYSPKKTPYFQDTITESFDSYTSIHKKRRVGDGYDTARDWGKAYKSSTTRK